MEERKAEKKADERDTENVRRHVLCIFFCPGAYTSSKLEIQAGRK